MGIKRLNHHELLVILSSLQDQPIVQIHYPPEDRNAKSRWAVTDSLRETGYHDAAQAIDDGATFLVVDSVGEALRLREAIESHSAALSAHLYWKGLENDEVREGFAKQQHPSTLVPRFGHGPATR